jgi:hypothetical protein
MVSMRNRIRIQRFKVNVDPDPVPDPGVKMTKNLKKKVTANKKEKFF